MAASLFVGRSLSVEAVAWATAGAVITVVVILLVDVEVDLIREGAFDRKCNASFQYKADTRIAISQFKLRNTQSRERLRKFGGNA